MPIDAGLFSCPVSRPARDRAHAIAPFAVIVLLALVGFASAQTAWAEDGGPPHSTSPSTSQAQLEEVALKAVDVFPIRFGGVLRLITGSVLLVPASLFSTLSLPFDRNPGVYVDNYEQLVLEPFDYTFRRPLGEDLGGL